MRIAQVIAFIPRISRPAISVWISVVPSGIMPPRVSRKMRSIGYSSETGPTAQTRKSADMSSSPRAFSLPDRQA